MELASVVFKGVIKRTALSDLWQLRGGNPQSVTVSVKNAVHQHHGIAFMRQNGRQRTFIF